MLSSTFKLAFYTVLSTTLCLVAGQFNTAGFTDCDLICLGWSCSGADGCVSVDAARHCSNYSGWKLALDQCVSEMCFAADYQAFQKIKGQICTPAKKRDIVPSSEIDLGPGIQTSMLSSTPDAASTVLASAIVLPTRTLTLVDHPTNPVIPTNKILRPLKMSGASDLRADTKLTVVVVGLGVGLVTAMMNSL